MPLLDVFSAPLYQVARVVLGAAALVYFRRVEVRHRERVPARGPLLVVANHPASFTDVAVLGRAVPRRLHFLAMAPIFRPWIRGFALRLCGTLPVHRRADDPSLMGRNDETFRACHEIFNRGGAVLIFPEGTSLTDRRIVRVKTGAARLALAHEARPGQEDRLTLLPIGLHFAHRTEFRSEVVVSVGRAIDLALHRDLARRDPQEAVRQLTDTIQVALEKLILHVPVDERAAMVDEIEALYRDEVQSDLPDVPGLGVARGMADCVEYFARTDPARIHAGQLRIAAYQQRLTELKVRDRAVREMLPRPGRLRERLRLLALGLLGLGPAVIGGLVHYVPYRLSAEIGSRATRDPTRMAAFRIGAGVVLFPLTYTALALGLTRLGWSSRAIVAALLLLVPLGLHALAYFNWLAHQRQRLRLVALKISHRRLVVAVRRERRELIRMFEQARADHGAAMRDARTQAGEPPTT